MSDLPMQNAFDKRKSSINEWKHQIVTSTVPETQLVPCYKALITGPSDTISLKNKKII